MEIIKDNDGWVQRKWTSYLDDIAYYLYQTEHMKKKEAMVPQWHVVRNSETFHVYYDKAKIFIRKEKLDKIKNNLVNQ